MEDDLQWKSHFFQVGELGVQVNIITGDRAAFTTEECRVVKMETQTLTIKDIPSV